MNACRTPTVPMRSHGGFTLVELMVAMVLGLLLVAAATGIFLSNSRAYRATEGVSRVQENARAAFELLSRELREAGATPCSRDLPVANVLKNATGNWWSNWGSGVVGYDNGGLAGAATGTDAVEILSASAGSYTVGGYEPTKSTGAEFTLTTSEHDLEVEDILLVCDYSQASIFEMTGPNATNHQVIHNTGSSQNCTKGLGLPVDCSNTNGTVKHYGPNSRVARLRASRWYVADNGRGRRSLYRVQMRKGSPQQPEEVAEGVEDLQITYLLNGSYVPANSVTDWRAVTAVRVDLLFRDDARVGSAGEVVERHLVNVVSLRNRLA